MTPNAACLQTLVMLHVAPQHTGSGQRVPPPEQGSGSEYVQSTSAVHPAAHAEQCDSAATNVPGCPPALAHSAAVTRDDRSCGSPRSAQMCQPGEQASTGAAHDDAVSSPHSPPTRGARRSIPPLHVALQPAMVGNAPRSMKASRSPSEHPIRSAVPPSSVMESSTAPSLGRSEKLIRPHAVRQDAIAHTTSARPIRAEHNVWAHREHELQLSANHTSARTTECSLCIYNVTNARLGVADRALHGMRPHRLRTPLG